MPGAASPLVGSDADLVYREACLAQPPVEGRRGALRPYGQQAARRQRSPGRRKAFQAVEAVIAGMGQPFGAVVDVEQDRIEAVPGM